MIEFIYNIFIDIYLVKNKNVMEIPGTMIKTQDKELHVFFCVCPQLKMR